MYGLQKIFQGSTSDDMKKIKYNKMMSKVKVRRSILKTPIKKKCESCDKLTLFLPQFCKSCIDRLYRNTNKRYLRWWHRTHYFQNKQYINRRSRKYYEKNKKTILAYQKGYYKERSKIDPAYVFKTRFQSRISYYLKSKKPIKRFIWEKYLGYSLIELKDHLEVQFKKGMSWDNYGKEWQLDHIKPQRLFRFRSFNSKRFKECWKLSNLRPLWTWENIKHD